jgi:hypothetical protein
MSESPNPLIVCESCGKRYKWQPRLAGKAAKCVCGAILKLPGAPVAAKAGQPAEDDLYKIADAPAPEVSLKPPRATAAAGAVATSDPSSTSTASPSAGPRVARINPDELPYGVPRRKGLKQEETKPDYVPSPLRDVYIPLALIPVGIVLNYIEVFARPPLGKTVIGSTPDVLIQMVLNLGLMIGGVVLASAAGGVSFFDKWPTTILKLCPVALVPGAIAGIIITTMGEINGAIIGNLLAVGLYWSMFWALFRLPAPDTTVCVMIFWIMRVAAAYGAYRIEEYRTGAWI